MDTFRISTFNGSISLLRTGMHANGLPDVFYKNTSCFVNSARSKALLSCVVIRKWYRENREIINIIRPQLIISVFWLAHDILVYV